MNHPKIKHVKRYIRRAFQRFWVHRVNPLDVLFDAKTYQFKAGGDSRGVTDRLRDVKRWDPLKSGKVILHRRLDGRLYVVDGHQRVAFAQRAKEAGQRNVHLDAIILNEADGFTAAEMRVIAAGKNLAEGSGTAVDAARIIREAGAENVHLQDIPRSSAVFTDGQGLAKLGDEAFEFVVNEVVDPKYGAHVGRLISDPAEQAATMRALVRARPQNSAEALSVVQECKIVGFRPKKTEVKSPEGKVAGDQVLLFDEDAEWKEWESLQGIRAQIHVLAKKKLKRDKALFKYAVRNEERLAETGNVFDREGNLERIARDEELERAIDEARFKGPAAELLNEVAKRADEGENPVSLADEWAEAVKRQVLGTLEDGHRPSGPPVERGVGGSGRSDQPGFNVGQKVLVKIRNREVPAEVRRVNLEKRKVTVKREDNGKVLSYSADNVRPRDDMGGGSPETFEAIHPGSRGPGLAQRHTPPVGGPRATSAGPGNLPDVESKQSLARSIAQALNVRIQYGRAAGMRRQNPGRYHGKRKLIEAARSGDLQAVYHEAGHALDLNHNVRDRMSPEAIEEIERLGDPGRTKGSMSSWKPGQGKERLQREGMAELLRLWFEDEDLARGLAPRATVDLNILLDHSGDMGRNLRKVQADFKLRQESPSAARVKSQIVFDRPGNRLTVDEVITSLYDEFHPISVMTDRIRDAKGVDELPPSQDPYVMARLIRGLPKVIESFLGIRSKKTGQIMGGSVEFGSREIKPGSKSLKAILEPLEDNADQTGRFVTYLVARRAQEYLDRGLHPGFHPDDVAQTLKDLDSPEFQQMAQDIYKWNDEVLQYAVDGGFITEDTAAIWREMNQSYVPFHRIMELGANEFPEMGGKSGKGLQATDPDSFKRLRGMRDSIASTEIVNPLESMIQNAMSIIMATERNRIGQVLAHHWDENVEGIGDFYREVTKPVSVTKADASELVSAKKLRKELEDLGADLSGVEDDVLAGMLANFEGLIARQRGIPDAGTNTIRVKMPDGTVRMFEMEPEVYKAWSALGQEEIPAFIKYLGDFAQGLRLGATTLSPPFLIRNPVRDSFAAGIVSRVGSVPLQNLLQGLAAIFDPRIVREWSLNGGAQSLEANLFNGEGFERAVLDVASGLSQEARKNTWLPRRLLGKLNDRLAGAARGARRGAKSQLGRTLGAVAEGFIENPIDMLGRLAEASEMATRLAEYKNAVAYYKRKYPDWSDADIKRRAAYESRDLLDFSMRGAGTVRHVRRVVPFYGSRMTGNYRLMRALKENPRATVAKAMWMISVPTLAFYAWNQDVNPDNYNQLPQRERDTFWHVATGDGPEDFIRIPKPFLEGALFGSTIERFAQFAWKKDPEAFRGFLKSLGDEVLPVNPLEPQSLAGLGGPGVRTLVEVLANHDFYRQRPIVPEHMRNDRNSPRPAWMESNEYTTATSKMLGKVLRKHGVELSPMMMDHVIRSTTGTAGADFVRKIADPIVHAATGEELPKRSPRRWLGFVYSENFSESEDRFWRLFKDVGDRAAEAKQHDADFADQDLWTDLKKASRRVQKIRKQLRESDDETERRRLLDELREVTSEFTPAAGPNVLSR